MTALLAGHDLILSLGGPLNLYHAEGSGPHVPEDAICWIVGDNPGALAWAPVGNAILGNTRAVAEQLLALGKPSDRPAPARRPAPPELNRTILDDRLALQCIMNAMPANAIVVEEAPTSRPPMQSYLQFRRPDCFFTTASGGLGYGMPAAVGVSLARPDARVIAIIGDGSAMYGIQSLFSAFQLGAPITFVIINNGKYQALRDFGQTFGMQRVVGTDLSGLDFCALAKGHGMPAGRQVTDVVALERALADSFSAEGPALIEVLVH
jgi:benzoylformate decarboxylase